MELIYGNDGMNYRVFAKSSGISPKAEQLLENSYMKYYFVKNHSVYSSPAKEPESIYYVTSDLGTALPREQVILAKNGRMSQRGTPSYYFHAHLEDTDQDYYKERFFRIFQMRFVSDLEAAEFDQERLNSYTPSYDETIRPGALSLDQIRMVLCLFFYQERLGRPVRILLDRSGDEYNRRAREVLMDIYRYLPYDFRKRYGFLSYTDEEQASVSRISFELFDRAQVRQTGEMDLDLEHSVLKEIRDRINKPQICGYVDYVTSLSEEDRISHFDSLEKMAAGKRLTVQDCISFFSYEKEWKEKPVRTLMPVWADYIYANGQRGGAMFERLCGIISDRLDNETYQDYLRESIEKQKVSVLNLPEQIRRLLLMADSISSLSFDIDWFVEWETGLFNNSTYRTAGEKYDAVSGIMNSLDRLRFGSVKFESVLKALKESFSIELEDAEAQMKREQKAEEEKEKARLETMFQDPGLGCDEQTAGVLMKTYEGLKTDELRRVFGSCASRIIAAAALRLSADKNTDLVRLEEGKNAIRKMMTIMDQDALNQSLDAIDRREKELKILELQNCAPIALSSRKDIPMLIRELYRREQVISDPEQYPDVVLILPSVPEVGTFQLTMHHGQAVEAAEFLTAPDSGNAEGFSMFIATRVTDYYSDCLKEMLFGGLFELSHYPYLKKIAEDLRDKALADEFRTYFEKQVSACGLSSGNRAADNPPGAFSSASKGKNTPFTDPFSKPSKAEEPGRGSDGRSAGLFGGFFKRQ